MEHFFLKADEPSEAVIQKDRFTACKMFSDSVQKILFLTLFSPFVSKFVPNLFLASYFQKLYLNFITSNGSKLLHGPGIEVLYYKAD